MTKKEFIERYGEEAYRMKLEWHKQYKKQYRETHKEQVRERKKQYREIHKDELKERSKQYYQQHKEEIKEQVRQYKRKNKCMFAYCIQEEIEQIENYELAKADNFDGWDIHHRLETHNSDGEKRLVNISVEELKALDMYYNRPASELIFLTRAEHTKLHFKLWWRIRFIDWISSNSDCSSSNCSIKLVLV